MKTARTIVYGLILMATATMAWAQEPPPPPTPQQVELQKMTERLLLLRQRGDWERALALLDRMKEANPNHPGVWYAIGEIRGAEGPFFDQAKAIAAFNQYLDLNVTEDAARRMTVQGFILDLEDGKKLKALKTAEEKPGAIATLRAYLSAATWQEQVPYVLDPENTRKRMADHYRGTIWQPLNFRIDAGVEPTPSEDGWVRLDAIFGTLSREYYLFKTPDGYRVHWESSEGYSPGLGGFKTARSTTPIRVRAWARAATYYNYDFNSKQSEYLSVGLAFGPWLPARFDVYSDYGYLSRSNPRASLLLQALDSSMFRQVVIDIAYPSNSQAPNHFLITGVVSTDGWWYKDDPTIPALNVTPATAGSVNTAPVAPQVTVNQERSGDEPKAFDARNVIFRCAPTRPIELLYYNPTDRPLYDVRVKGTIHVVDYDNKRWVVPVDVHWNVVPPSPPANGHEARYATHPKGLKNFIYNPSIGKLWELTGEFVVTGRGDTFDRLGL